MPLRFALNDHHAIAAGGRAVMRRSHVPVGMGRRVSCEGRFIRARQDRVASGTADFASLLIACAPIRGGVCDRAHYPAGPAWGAGNDMSLLTFGCKRLLTRDAPSNKASHTTCDQC